MDTLIFPNSSWTGFLERFLTPLNTSQYEILNSGNWSWLRDKKGVSDPQYKQAAEVRAGLDKKLVITGATSTHSSGEQHVRN